MPARYDLVVVGGGFQGAFLALEASRRGLDVLLLEKGRMGEGTSDQSLRVVHGGFRYLQSLDLGRHRISQREQRWFLEHLGDLIQPLRCVLPLEGSGLRRPQIAQAACLYDAVMGRSSLPRARVLDAAECQATLGFAAPGAVGGLEWHDALLRSGSAVVRALAEWARALGAHLVEDAATPDLVVQDGTIRGVRGGVDAHAPAVIVAAGGANPDLAKQFGCDVPKTSPLSSWIAGYNVVLDRPPLFEGGFGFRASVPDSPAYFCLPRGDQMVLGTLYGPVSGAVDPAAPPMDAVRRALDALRGAIPQLSVGLGDVVGYDVGVLPASRDKATPASRPLVVQGPSIGGPPNLWFVTPEKFTTTRAVAENVLRQVFGSLRAPGPGTERPAPSAQSVGGVTCTP